MIDNYSHDTIVHALRDAVGHARSLSTMGHIDTVEFVGRDLMVAHIARYLGIRQDEYHPAAMTD